MHKILQLVAVVLLAVSTGVSLTRVIQMIPGVGLTGAGFVDLMRVMVGGLDVFTAVVEVLALAALIGLAVLSRWERRSLLYFAIAGGVVALVLLVHAALVLPLAGAMSAWTVASIPADWEVFRNQWITMQLVRVLLGLGALVLTQWGIIRFWRQECRIDEERAQAMPRTSGHEMAASRP